MVRRRMARAGKAVIDVTILAISFCMAFVLRFESALPAPFVGAMLVYLPNVLAAKLAILSWTGRFKTPWRYVNLRDAVRLFACHAAVAVPLLVWTQTRSSLPYAWAHHESAALPVGVILIDLVLSFIGMCGARAIVRMMSERRQRLTIEAAPGECVPTLLCGAGRAGALVAKEMQTRRAPGVCLVGFVDDDESLAGMHVEGLPVLGTSADMARLVDQLRVRQVIITIASDQEDVVPRITKLCKSLGLRAKIIPPFHEIVEGEFNLAAIRDVSIEDLLRRSPVRLDNSEVAKIVRKQVVLVTGAGGSIGSELCRIVAGLHPATLVLVEQAENSLFHVHMSLREAFPDLHIVPCIADICDEERMDAIFAQWRPPLVIHAAAHKHVPMMEWNPGEAVKNNVLGTRTVATLADVWQVERFVMISTDKAVNPTSVMGVSKRISELFVQAKSRSSSTRFMTVRFGNVLGSAGSVIPIFQKQIAAGGPVTVTHPEMKRYFMTIPEACQLVLQAGAMGQGGELFILDMGEPVKIVDLARDLIRLSKGKCAHEVEIHFTGLRPGEKLFEELALGEEDALKTTHPRIFIGKVKSPSLHWITRQIDELSDLACRSEVTNVLAKLKEIVPEYQYHALRQDPAAPALAPPLGPRLREHDVTDEIVLAGNAAS